MTSGTFRLSGLLAVGLLAIFLMPVSAGAVTFSCDAPDPDDCNGNEYAISWTSVDSNTVQLTVSVHILSTYTGNQWTDKIQAIGIKDVGYVSGTGSIVSSPNSGWSFVQTEVDGACIPPPNSTDRFCAYAGPTGGIGFTLGDTLSWVFQFDTTGIGDTAHLKYVYVTEDNVKIGSLGSFDQGVSSSGGTSSGGTSSGDIPSSSNGNNVPEPASSLVLFGLGLLGLGFARRVKHSA